MCIYSELVYVCKYRCYSVHACVYVRIHSVLVYVFQCEYKYVVYTGIECIQQSACIQLVHILQYVHEYIQ